MVAAAARAALLLVAALLVRAPGVSDDTQRLHVGIDFGSEFAKVALELTAGGCSAAASGAAGGRPCRGLVHRSDPVVLTAAGKVRALSVLARSPVRSPR
jgi:hypothetical protein